MPSKSFDYESIHSIVLRECALILSRRTIETSFAEHLKQFRSFLRREDIQRALQNDSENKKIIPVRHIVLDTMTTLLKVSKRRQREDVPSKRAAFKEMVEITLCCISSCLESINTRRLLWKDKVRFWKVFDAVISTLTGSDADMKSSSANETTKMCCVDTLANLFSHKTYEQHLFRMTRQSDNIKLRIGHCISILLSIAETYHDGSLALRIRALDVLEMLCRALCDSHEVSRHDIQSGCRSFLPGISSALCRLIRPTATASSRLMISALLVWATALSSSLSIGSEDDDHVEELKDNDGTQDVLLRLEKMMSSSRVAQEEEEDGDFKSSSGAASSLEEYIKNTSKHVLERAKIVVPIVAHHKNWRARAAAVTFATRVLCVNKKGVRLGKCAAQLLGPPLIEVVLALRQDSQDEVSSLAKRSFESIQQHLSTTWTSLVPIIRDRLRSTVLSLPRVARRQRSGDEMQLEASLRLLQGHLELIRTQGGTLPLQSIVSSLLSVLECDPDVRNNGGRIGVAVDTSSYYRIPFRYMRSTATTHAARDVCIELSRVASTRDEFPNLVEDILSSLNQDAIPTVWAPSLYILSRIFFSEDATKNSRIWTLIPYIADTILESRHWKSSTSAAELISTSSSRQPVREADRNALVIALSCEAIASIGRSAAKGDGVFELLLLRVLYPLLERVKDPHPIVCQAASATLKSLSISGKHSSTEHLLKANLDYLVDALLSRLRYLSLYPRTPSVLTVLWKHIDAAALQPLLRDCARHSLRRLRQDSSRNEPHTLDLLRLLSAIAQVICSRCDDHVNTHQNTRATCEDSFLQALRNVKSRVKMEEPRKQRNVRNVVMSKEERVTSEELQSLAKDIAEVCLHFVGLDSPLTLHLESSDALCNAILAVCAFERRFENSNDDEDKDERQNVLLPLVHRTWPVILECFRVSAERVHNSSLRRDSEDDYDAASFLLSSDVLAAALHILRVSANVSGSFICSRFEKELWPHLRRIVTYCTISVSESEQHMKSWDRRDSLLKDLLETASKVLRDIVVDKANNRRVNIRDMVVDMGRTFFPFLNSKRYSVRIQELSLDIFRELLRHDADAIWHQLFTHASEKYRSAFYSVEMKSCLETLSYDSLRILPPSFAILHKTTLVTVRNGSEEFDENVDKLLEHEASKTNVEDDWNVSY